MAWLAALVTAPDLFSRRILRPPGLLQPSHFPSKCSETGRKTIESEQRYLTAVNSLQSAKMFRVVVAVSTCNHHSTHYANHLGADLQRG